MGRDISETEPAVDSSLARWQKMLNDVALLRDMPRIYRDNLATLLDDLQQRGVIDALKRFDMNEMVEAAYSHEVEEQQVLRRYLVVSGSYELIHDGSRVGEVRGVRVYLGADTRDRTPAQYDAWITRTDNGLEAFTKFKKFAGRVDGKRFYTAAGDEYELVETSRLIASKDVNAIDDHDIYRAVLDAMQHAEECGDTAWYQRLSTRASVSMFMPCPQCLDLFSKSEDCQECEGLGIVKETPERFRWRC